MSTEAPQKIKRGEHRVPRWITILWMAFVVILALTSIVLAVRLECGPVQTLGFLVASSILIFVLSAVAWLALYGLSILLEGLDYHETHCDDSKHWAGMGDFM
jgi:hypothetical protein